MPPGRLTFKCFYFAKMLLTNTESLTLPLKIDFHLRSSVTDLAYIIGPLE